MKIFNLQEKILTSNENYLLATNASGKILYQEHFQPHLLSKPDLREILGIITSGSFSAYLIKVHNGSILPPDDFSWVENFTLMRLFKAGISHVAYVSPQNIFHSLEMEKELKPGKILTIRIFKKMNDAVQWLGKQCDLNLEMFKPTAEEN